MTRFFLPVLLPALLAACTSRPATEATTQTDSARLAPATSGTLVATAVPPRLLALGLQPSHDWRAVTVGDVFAAAKATETAAPFEQDSTHVGYTQEFSNLESVDYQYSQRAGVVSAIEVDFYLNTAGAVEAYRQDLTTYLSARYGPATTTQPVSSWQNGRVTLRNVSKRKDYGLKLTIKR